MIARTSVRWRLVAWVTGVLLAVAAVIFVVVYEQTGTELRTEVDQDVAGDLSQLSQTVKGVRPRSPQALLAEVGAYLRAQPFSSTSSLLFAAIDGHGAVSNPPALLGNPAPDDGESTAEQAHENALGQALLRAPTRITTQQAPDIGPVRLDERVLRVGTLRVRVGAGEPLAIVTRAQRSIVRSFAIAGALGVVLALRCPCPCAAWRAWRLRSTTAIWIRGWTPRRWPRTRSACWRSLSTACSTASPKPSRPNVTSSPTHRMSCARPSQ
jgi:hypothetical protein